MSKKQLWQAVKFTLFFNLPNSPEWREARVHIAEHIRNNFHNTTLQSK